MSIGVGELFYKKKGLASEAEIKKMSEQINESLKSMLESLVQTRQMKSAVEAVKAMIEEEKPSPLAGLKELGIDIGSIIKGDREVAQTALAELHKAREQILEEKAKNIDKERSERLEELTTAEKLINLMIGLSNKTSEQQMALLREVYNERIKALESSKEKTKESDPIQDFIMSTAVKLMQDQLTRPQPDPIEQLSKSISMFETLQNMMSKRIGQDSLSSSKDVDLKRLDLEWKKIELENERLLKEAEERRKLEERKAENFNNLINKLGEMLPLIVSTFNPSAKEEQAAIQTSNKNKHKIICANCGEEIITSSLNDIVCPRCKSKLAVGPQVSQQQPPRQPVPMNELMI